MQLQSSTAPFAVALQCQAVCTQLRAVHILTEKLASNVDWNEFELGHGAQASWSLVLWRTGGCTSATGCMEYYAVHYSHSGFELLLNLDWQLRPGALAYRWLYFSNWLQGHIVQYTTNILALTAF